MIRQAAKGIAEATLSTWPLRRLLARVPGDGVLILAYHNVVSDPSATYGDTSLHLPVDAFAEQLACLEREADVVGIAAVGRGAGRSRPRVAITFDDAYAGAVRHALPLLAARRWPVTVFVSPGMLGGRTFWWDSVTDAGGRELPQQFRRQALADLGGRDADVRAAARRAGLTLRTPPIDATTAAEDELLAALGKNPHLTLGAHTWSHVCLPTVPSHEAEEEIVRSLDWVRGLRERGVAQLAYPYGEHSPEVAAIAARCGASGAYLVEGGWHRPTVDAVTAIPRLNVPAGMSAAGFRLRLHGVLR